jgi:phenylacetate-CoA ligase
VQWRGRQWWNLDRGNKQLTLWGRPVAANPTSDLWVKLKAHLRNSMQVNTFEEFNEAKLEQILQLFLHKRPKLLYGYGSSIARLAAYTATRDVQPEQFGHCNLIEYTADAMTSAEKVLAEQVFGCPVVSAYGASEAPGIAQQCPEGNAHVAVDNVFLEWMPTEATNSGAPRSSEILVTTLNNFAMPLIRYRLGDEGYPLAGACNCGVSLPLMGLSVGKSMSLISTSSRQDISGHVLDYILISLLRDGFTGIGQFFVEQITLDYFEFYFVRCEPFRSNSTHEFVRRMKTELGEQIQVRISEVSNIEPRSSGKRTYFETRL